MIRGASIMQTPLNLQNDARFDLQIQTGGGGVRREGREAVLPGDGGEEEEESRRAEGADEAADADRDPGLA
jgi:hypothetical protein